MFYAAVETDIGEILNVIRSDGHLGGDAILSFLLGLSGYCSGSDDSEMAWFGALNARSEVQTCQLLSPLLDSFYSGDWDYGDDEYDVFQRREAQSLLTEEQFIETVHAVQKKWTDLAAMLSATEALLTMMNETELAVSSWYNGRYTVADFEALLQTLQLAQGRKAQQVRIRFR